jgi:HAD superfamily hydrolase (TIGR01549 family)
MWDKEERLKSIERDGRALGRKITIEETKNSTMVALFDFLLNFSRPKLHKDTIALLDFLRRRGKVVVLFSNGRGGRIMKELERTGIRDRFDMVVSAKDIGAEKPSPVGIRSIMERVGAGRRDTVYIGDTIDDILASDLAGISSCAVACGLDSGHTLRSGEPDYLFSSIGAMFRSLKSGKA